MHFSQNVLPTLFNETKLKIEEESNSADSIATTTDGWTSHATASYLTITARYVNNNWQIANPILQTCALFERHTSEHLSEIIKEAVAEWKISRSHVPVPVTTDNCFL